jgi:mitochondrial fission protein ELM1
MFTALKMQVRYNFDFHDEEILDPPNRELSKITMTTFFQNSRDTPNQLSTILSNHASKQTIAALITTMPKP